MTDPVETSPIRRSPYGDHTACARIGETQTVLLVGHDLWLSGLLAPLCEALDIRVVCAASHHDVPIRLHRDHPICIVSGLEAAGPTSCAILRSVAAYDPDMPVLLITGDDPAIDGAIDVAERLWGLTGLFRLSNVPGPGDMMNFLFLAGRKDGTGRLMPIS